MTLENTSANKLSDISVDIKSLTNLEKEKFSSPKLIKFSNIYNIISNAAFQYSNQNKIS